MTTWDDTGQVRSEGLVSSGQDSSSQERNYFISVDISLVVRGWSQNSLRVIPINSYFLFASQSVIWLPSLLKLDKYKDTSSFGWTIFLIFLDIPGMSVHQFLMFLNFLYFCQSVSWLTALLKLYILGYL